ncbi:uncharacterized protein BCR38DRAFT_219934 [Pseudomassariella vexata]|uniref:VOC domain-containing protein n=1 Tax=Pseudomassariella vexata TaxID=1141098 RepID=A0A1Y2DUU8_9PEZI|nr:uncharacterized protein BCR38DRAFT_219934 [Pseudomassariella vexata]ORY63043.1 hypothetical protein BCR38DRAFT_219934 [Pseudomassariella vexata]
METPDAPSTPLITGLAHINLTIPLSTLPHAHSFYGLTLGLTPLKVPVVQTHELAWFAIGSSGQQVHISTQKHEGDLISHNSSRHPCFKIGSAEALLELQSRIYEHFQRGEEGAPVAADRPGESSGEKGKEYPGRFFARDFAGNRLEFSL